MCSATVASPPWPTTKDFTLALDFTKASASGSHNPIVSRQTNTAGHVSLFTAWNSKHDMVSFDCMICIGQKYTLEIYHGNILSMENKHSKCFIVKQSKGSNLGLKCARIYVWRPDSARIRWGSFGAPPDPLAAVRCLLLREGGEGR